MFNLLNNVYKEHCEEKIKGTDTTNIVLWHLVFVVIIPLYLYKVYGVKSFRYYLPLIDLIAAGFVYVGYKHFKVQKNHLKDKNNKSNKNNKEEEIHYFQGLFDVIPKSYISYFSAFIINLLALSGVAIHSILWSTNKGLFKGVLVAIIMYGVTYLLPSLWLPPILDEIIKYIDNKIKKLNNSFMINNIKIAEEIIVSLIVISLILFVEGAIIHHLILD